MIRTLVCSSVFFVSLLCSASSSAESGTLSFPAAGESKGKIVLVSGDEEYRSEESMPMLAKILSVKHGFDCTVLFSMSVDGSHVDPNHSAGIVGWETLDDADLMIIGTRFRAPGAADAKHISKFINDGKPLIGIRTATHAFNGKGSFGGEVTYADFGLKILGEQWVSHWGKHKVQGARGVIPESAADHPILNSVSDVFAPSDVYEVKHLSDQDTILMRAAITASLDPSSAKIDDAKNEPMQPFAWLHPYVSPSGTTGQSFCTTAGASVDLVNEDLRRMIVNATYFLLDQAVPEKADVAFVDPFYPTFFGFVRDQSYWVDLNIQPSDYGLGKSPQRPDPQGSPEWNFRARR